MFKYPSISRNLTLSLGLTIIIAGCLSLGLYYTFQMVNGKKELEKLGEEYIKAVSDSLRFSLWNLNDESTSLTCGAYAKNDLIVFLSVKDEVGNSIFHYDNRSVDVPALLQTLRIDYEGAIVGNVELALTTYHLKHQNRQVVYSGIVMIFLSFSCLILMTRFLLKRFLKKPLNTLQTISSEYAKGNFNLKTTMPIHTELLDFSKALNDMGRTIQSQMATLQQAEESLKKNQDQLEKAVTERTRELKENKQRLEAILKASPVGIGLVKDRRMEWANKTMYSMLGYGQDTLLGKSARILYENDKEYERVGQELYTSITKKEYAEIETKWRRKNGSVFECNLRTFPLDPDEPSQGLIVVVSDISNAKLLEAKLQQAEKMEAIGTLAGGVAHDLNNILSGIVSYPELLLAGIPADSPLRKPLQTIQTSGQQAAHIVQDLLTMARRGVSTNEVVNLNQVISEQLHSPEMKNLISFFPGVQVISHLDDKLLNVNGSPTHLSKSVMNLLSNAAEAMPEGGTISISTSNVYLDSAIRGYEQIAEGNYVKIVVSDNGIGISPKDMEKIFEPFFTRKSMARSGTGLGMAVVWGTVKDHKGYIDIESTEGVGTTTSFYLPITREELKEKSDGTLLPEHLGNGESILIIDDVLEQREVASAMLTKLGYSVSSVSSGAEAVEYIRAHSPDLLLLDMIMEPGLDGLDTYKQIITIRPRQRAIIASGFSKTDRVKELQTLGAGRYIIKPYTLTNIGSAVKEELKLRSQEGKANSATPP